MNIQNKQHRFGPTLKSGFGQQLLSKCMVIAVMVFIMKGPLAHAATCSSMTPGKLQNLNGFLPFQANSAWNTDVSDVPEDVNSYNILNFIGLNMAVKANFGSGTYRKQPIGIPYQIVSGTQPKVDVAVLTYLGRSDPGLVPIPPDALIEGSGNRRMIILDKDSCWLYELSNVSKSRRAGWTADSVAIFDMLGNPVRPFNWVSADSSGLAVMAGLVRYEEILAGSINHAIRFTVPVTRAAITAPASNWASTLPDPNAPPMGMRMRLRADFDISGYSRTNQIILTAMKKYGIILSDYGNGIYISGVPDSRWNNSDLSQLGNIKASNFQVLRMDTVYTPSYVLPSGHLPVISSFTANLNDVSPGTPVTLNWSTTGSSGSIIITPSVGPVRGDMGFVTVQPTQTTTYTIYATNWYGRNFRTVTVTVR